MSLNIRCFVCDNWLEEPGALLFTPPDEGSVNNMGVSGVRKLHICKTCYEKIYKKLEEGWLAEAMNESTTDNVS